MKYIIIWSVGGGDNDYTEILEYNSESELLKAVNASINDEYRCIEGCYP